MTRSAQDHTMHLIALAYGAAVEPDKFDHLLDAWDRWCELHLDENEDVFHPISTPFEDAIGLAEKLEHSDAKEGFSGIATGAAAAVLLDATRAVVQLNEVAAKLIPQSEIENGLFAHVPQPNCQDEKERPRSAYRIGGGPGQRTYLAIETSVDERLRKRYPTAETRLLISLLDWNDTYAHDLARHLRLSAAELNVTRGLLTGMTAQEIAGDLGRSVETIRSHIKALLKKTGARRQTELVQFLTILRQVADEAPQIPVAPALVGDFYQYLIPTPVGPVEIVRYGSGRPLLYFATSSLPQETERVRTSFSTAGFEVFAAARPGFGRSSPVVGDASDAFLTSVVPALLEHMPENPVLVGHREGGILAAKVARQLVENGNPPAGLVMISTGAAARDIHAFRHAPEIERRSFLAARLARPALVLGYKTAARLFRSGLSGEKRIVTYFFSSSPVDSELVKNSDFYDIIRENLHFCFEHPEQIAHDVALWGSDWSDALFKAKRACKVIFVHGAEHNFLPLGPIESIAFEHENVELGIVDEAGQMALYVAPELIAESIANAFAR